MIGIAANDADINEQVKVIISGKAKGLRALEAGVKYYLGINGGLTPVVPTTALKDVPVGIAFSETELLIQLGSEKLTSASVIN